MTEAVPTTPALQADANLPIPITLPLGQVMGLINLLAGVQYGALAQAGLLQTPELLIQQANAHVAAAQAPKTRQQRRAENRTPKPATTKAAGK